LSINIIYNFFVSINAGNFFGTTVSTKYYFTLILRLELRMRDEGKSSSDALPLIALFTTNFVRTTQRLVRTPASHSGDRWLKSGWQSAVVIFQCLQECTGTEIPSDCSTTITDLL